MIAEPDSSAINANVEEGRRGGLPLRTSRRGFLVAGGALTLTLIGAPRFARAADLVAELVIDLTSEPANLDPATTYDANGWSIVHSMYDSLYQYGPDGQLEPLLAQDAPTLIDPTTFEIRLRPGITFHNGEPVDAKAVAFSVAHILDEKTGSQVAGNFAVITEVREVDPLTVQLVLARPAPWLPAQIAAWLAILPPVYAAANDIQAAPVGTGPYRFVEWKAGERIALEANPDYFADSPKGRPIADRVTYRFVPESSTRVADLLAGTAGLVRDVAPDQVEAVESGGASVIEQAVSGSAWIRIPTDVAPFDDVRVRQALNYAIDVDAVINALLGGNGQRLANFFAPGGLGFDATVEPFAYDPDKARALLVEAGHPNGFETAIDYAITERKEIVEAITGMLSDVGVRTTARGLEQAVFNGPDWWLGTNAEAAPLRFATWRPLFDPYTLLSLVVSNQGFLSRHDNPTIQLLIDAFSTETDVAARAEKARQLGRALRDEPAAIYLYSLTALYGVVGDTPGWTPRPDEYLIATARG